MTVSISDKRRATLLARITDFAQAGRRRSLKDFLSIAGHINWYLTVFPLLHPCLSALYAKTAGKTQMLGLIRVNNTIHDEITWFVRRAATSEGICLLKNVVWDPTLADSDMVVCYADACMDGMAYWFPELGVAFQCRIPTLGRSDVIFYYEALTVMCAFLQALPMKRSRFVTFTDNTNTVDVWNSLKATQPYNRLLITAIDHLLDVNVDARVLHVPGVENLVADALSRFNNAYAMRLVPDLQIYTFQPPHGLLGAAKK
jgi:hypothetical protein